MNTTPKKQMIWCLRDKTNEEVRKQFKRLNDESVLPMAVDNGEEIIVSSIGMGKATGTPFFNYLTLLHRDPNGKETLGEYQFVGVEKLDQVDGDDGEEKP